MLTYNVPLTALRSGAQVLSDAGVTVTHVVAALGELGLDRDPRLGVLLYQPAGAPHAQLTSLGLRRFPIAAVAGDLEVSWSDPYSLLCAFGFDLDWTVSTHYLNEVFPLGWDDVEPDEDDGAAGGPDAQRVAALVWAVRFWRFDGGRHLPMRDFAPTVAPQQAARILDHLTFTSTEDLYRAFWITVGGHARVGLHDPEDPDTLVLLTRQGGAWPRAARTGRNSQEATIGLLVQTLDLLAASAAAAKGAAATARDAILSAADVAAGRRPSESKDDAHARLLAALPDEQHAEYDRLTEDLAQASTTAANLPPILSRIKAASGAVLRAAMSAETARAFQLLPSQVRLDVDVVPIAGVGAVNLSTSEVIFDTELFYERYVPAPLDPEDMEKFRFAVLDGILRIQNGQRVEPPAILHTMLDLWSRSLSGGNLTEFFQRLCGAGLSGRTFQTLLVIYGSGGTGKSTALAGIGKAIGAADTPGVGHLTKPLATVTAGEALASFQPGAPNPNLAKAVGARWAVVDEADGGSGQHGFTINGARIKYNTGGGQNDARMLRKNPEKGNWEATWVCATQFAPEFVAFNDTGLRRRVLALELTAASRLPSQNAAAADEWDRPEVRGQIVAWALQGAIELTQDNRTYDEARLALLPPVDLVMTADRLLTAPTDIDDWLEAQTQAGQETELRTLFKGFKEWASASGLDRMLQPEFIKALQERGYYVGPRGSNPGGDSERTRVVRGLTLRPVAVAAFDPAVWGVS